jgi:acetyl esterase/lipase
MTKTLEALARQGYVAVAPDYRLAPKHRFPGCLEDCKAAIRWVRANASRLRVDSSRVGVVGLAAGGHLACLLGVTTSADHLEGEGGNPEQSSRVQAVVSFFGPTDLTQPIWGPEAKRNNLEPLLGGTQANSPDAYRKASPVTYVKNDPPPFLFLHGGNDQVVPPSQSRDLAERLRKAGGSAKVVIMEGEGHGFQGDNVRRGITEMLVFLDETLKK